MKLLIKAGARVNEKNDRGLNAITEYVLTLFRDGEESQRDEELLLLFCGR